MTTIVADRACMAADSKVTDDDSSFRTIKIVRVRGDLIGAAGASDDCAKFLRWYRGGCKRAAAPDINAENFRALVLRPSGLYFYCSADDPDEILDEYYAIGTGAMAALVRMDCGGSPTDGVEAACRRDNNSGPPVQVEYLDNR